MLHEDCHIKQNEGRDPTQEDCAKCDRIKDTALQRVYATSHYFDKLIEYMATPDGQEMLTIMRSDQMCELYTGIKLRSHMTDSKLAMLNALGVQLDLVIPIHTALALGYMIAKLGYVPEVMTHGTREQAAGGSVTDDVTKFLEGLNNEGDNGTQDSGGNQEA